LDLPSIMHRFLADPAAAHPAAIALSGMLPKMLASVEDGRARRVLARVVPRIVGGPAAGHVVARALHSLVDGGRHQEVFGFILEQLKNALGSREDALRTAIEERVREQGGRLVGWALGASIARRVLGLVNAELDKMSPDGSELRLAFDEWVRREINRMETEPERAAEVGLAIRRVVAHETIQAWMWDIWARIRVGLEADISKPNGRMVAYVEGALGNIGTILEADPAARARLQMAAEGIIRTLLPSAQLRIAGFIGQVVASWDTATVVDRLELRVGRDLQYIRMNGTIVGFLLGGLLYLVLDTLLAHTTF
jgi:uncharacterized membrane-anchored protein YjiN (DUF445 family)